MNDETMDDPMDMEIDIAIDAEERAKEEDVATGRAAGAGSAEPGGAVLDDGAAVEVVEVVVDDGALRVHAGEGGAVRARGRGEPPTLRRDGARVRAWLPDGGDLEVPRGARLAFEELPAALSVRGVHGGVDGRIVGGDARLADVGPVTLGAVGRMLDAAGVAGALDVGTVGGHARVAGVGGDARLRTVGGSVRLADVQGDVEATAGGSAKVIQTPRAGGTYRVTAGGSVRWLSPDAPSAALSAVAGGRVRVEVSGAAHATGAPGGRHEVVLGDGGATIELTAGGSVRFGSGSGEEGWDVGPDGERLGDMAERFGVQIEGIAELVGQRIDATIGGLPEMLAQRGLSGEQIERIAERLQHVGERAAEQVERKLRRMSEQAERLGERAERMAERHRHRGGGAYGWTARPMAPAAPEPPRAPGRPAQPGAGAEEVMAILRMVEGGKISAEEAERLIAALGGRS